MSNLRHLHRLRALPLYLLFAIAIFTLTGGWRSAPHIARADSGKQPASSASDSLSKVLVATPAPTLVISGTEVNQGLPTYPLVAGKTTLVRVYTRSSRAGVPVHVDSAVLDVTPSGGAPFTLNATILNPDITNGSPSYSEQDNINFYLPGPLINEGSYSFQARLYRCEPVAASQLAGAATLPPTACPRGTSLTLIMTVPFNNSYSFWRTDDIRLVVVLPDRVAYNRPLTETAILADYLDDLARVFPVRDGWGNIGSNKGLQVVLRDREPVCNGNVGVIDCGPTTHDLLSENPTEAAITRFSWNLIQANPAGQLRTLCQDSSGVITPPTGVPCQFGSKPFRYPAGSGGGFATQFVPGTFLRTGGWTPNTAEPAYDLNNNGVIDLPSAAPSDAAPQFGDVGYYVAEFSNDGGSTWLTDLRQMRPGALVHSFIDSNRNNQYDSGEPATAPIFTNRLVSWMIQKATAVRDRTNALNPNGPQIPYAAYVIWPGMDRSGTGPGQAFGNAALWAWLDQSPGFHQELGHLFGLVSPASPNYDGGRHSLNMLVNDPKGFDILRRKALIPPWISVMAGRGLYSPYTNALLECAEYTQVFNQLKLSPNAPTYTLTCTGPSQPPQSLDSSNPARVTSEESDDLPQLALDLYLTEDDHLEIAHSHVTKGLPETPLSHDSPYTLVFQNAGGHLLAEDRIDVVYEPSWEAAHHATVTVFHHNTFLHIVRPLPAETAFVELRHGEHTLVHLVRPEHAPTIHLHPLVATAADVDASGAVTGTIPLAWDAAHPDGDPLTYDIAYSRDGGATWEPLASGYVSTTLAWDTSEIGGSNQALLRVEASDGFNVAASTSEKAFQVAAKPPVVSIITPVAGAIDGGLPLLLRAAAFDPQDGVLQDTAVRWSSSKDGELGSGSELVTRLTAGFHLLTVRVTDSQGLVASAQEEVVVGSRLNLPLLVR